jgi:hypothetical protein
LRFKDDIIPRFRHDLLKFKAIILKSIHGAKKACHGVFGLDKQTRSFKLVVPDGLPYLAAARAEDSAYLLDEYRCISDDGVHDWQLWEA